MSTIVLQPVVMAGGSGTRLWPLSRDAFARPPFDPTNCIDSARTPLGRTEYATTNGLGQHDLLCFEDTYERA